MKRLIQRDHTFSSQTVNKNKLVLLVVLQCVFDILWNPSLKMDMK